MKSQNVTCLPERQEIKNLRPRRISLGLKNEMPEVSIIVLNWNGYKETYECISSLKKITYPNYEIIVVDNGSTDGSEAKLRKRFPGTTVLQTGRNLGYTGGNNFGMRYVLERGTDYIFLLNNDTLVERDFLNHLVEYAELNEKVGAVGQTVCYAEDRELIQTAGMRLKMMGMRIDQVGNKQRRGSLTKPITDIQAINGVGVLLKKEVIDKVGLLDPDYFMYTEEIDWGYRIRKAGYSLAVVPKAVIYHKIPISGRRYNPKVLYCQVRGKFIFLRKHGKWYHFPPLMLSICKLMVVSFLKVNGLKSRLSLVWSIIRGVIVGLSFPLTVTYG